MGWLREILLAHLSSMGDGPTDPYQSRSFPKMCLHHRVKVKKGRRILKERERHGSAAKARTPSRRPRTDMLLLEF